MEVTNIAGAYHVWTAPDGRVAIHLRLDVADRMLPEIMAAFGAVPRRGAEAGGVLLGTVEPGTPTVVRVEEFEMVPCSYKRGPSFLLSDLDYPRFEAAAVDGKAKDLRLRAVGYFRSNTRDAQTICDEDRAICTRFFPAPSGIMLLIKPYATRTSTAGFLTYENGRLPDAPRSEFPLRGVELARAADPSVPLPERRPLGVPAPGYRRERGDTTVVQRRNSAVREDDDVRERLDSAVRERNHVPHAPAATGAAPAPAPEHAHAPTISFAGYATPSKSDARRRTVMLLIPVAFALLFAGVLLGYYSARTFLAPVPEPAPNPYQVGLSATPEIGSLVVRWNRDGEPARRAERGVVTIDEEGQARRTVNISAAEIRTGALVLKTGETPVTIRLDLYMDGVAFVGQTLEPARPRVQ